VRGSFVFFLPVLSLRFLRWKEIEDKDPCPFRGASIVNEAFIRITIPSARDSIFFFFLPRQHSLPVLIALGPAEPSSAPPIFYQGVETLSAPDRSERRTFREKPQEAPNAHSQPFPNFPTWTPLPHPPLSRPTDNKCLVVKGTVSSLCGRKGQKSFSLPVGWFMR